MKRSIPVILFILYSPFLHLQTIGEWNPLFSYEKDIEAIIETDELVYAVSDGKLFSYDTSDYSLEGYAKIGEDSIIHLVYSKKNECIVAIRSNSDIDLIYSKSNYVNVPDLKNMSLNLDKKVNSVFIEDDFAYISTNFGLVIINIPKAEVKESALFSYPFYGTAVYNGHLFAFTQNGILTVEKNQNIQYPGNWSEMSFSSIYNGTNAFSDKDITKGFVFDGNLVFMVPSVGIYSYNGETVTGIGEITEPVGLIFEHNRLVAFNADNFWDFNSLDNVRKITVDNPITWIIPHNTMSNQYWVAFKNTQLSLVKADNENNYEILQQGIRPAGPLSNYSFDMVFSAGRLLVTGGSADNNPKRYPAALSEYRNRMWFHYSKEEVDIAAGVNSMDFLRIAVDPDDDSHIFVSCFGIPNSSDNINGGLYEFKNMHFVDLHNHLNTSVIEPVSNNTVFMAGLAFDKKGNLWAQNSYGANYPVIVRKNDGSWVGLIYSDIAGKVTNPRMVIVDKYNNKWMITYKGGDQQYLFVCNEGTASIDNVVAHNTKYIPHNSFMDQDGGSLSSITDLNCITEDKNGNIWLGTNIGIFVIYNSSNILNNDRNIVFNKIKIPKNDGTNEANILLENVEINTIAVDGANRKWIGTATGLYIVSSNGIETDYYFTMENSILPSNTILSIAIDPETGIAYIGTDKGIVTFRAEATEGAESYSNVYVFPNPVEPYYEGPVTVTGLKENSRVKITDIKGNLIKQGTSMGGQYIWDARNVRRERVDTGVYLIFGSSDDGKDGVVTKVMVISD